MRRYGDIANTRKSNFIGFRSVGVDDQRGLICKTTLFRRHAILELRQIFANIQDPCTLLFVGTLLGVGQGEFPMTTLHLDRLIYEHAFMTNRFGYGSWLENGMQDIIAEARGRHPGNGVSAEYPLEFFFAGTATFVSSVCKRLIIPIPVVLMT